MPRRAISAGFSAVMFLPRKKMSPAVGCRNLVSRLKTVVLPAPFGPIRAWISPCRTRKDTPSTATNPLKDFARACVSRITSLLFVFFVRIRLGIRLLEVFDVQAVACQELVEVRPAALGKTGGFGDVARGPLQVLGEVIARKLISCFAV